MTAEEITKIQDQEFLIGIDSNFVKLHCSGSLNHYKSLFFEETFMSNDLVNAANNDYKPDFKKRTTSKVFITTTFCATRLRTMKSESKFYYLS